MILVGRISLLFLVILCSMARSSAQSVPTANPERPAVNQTQSGCDEAPGEDALVSHCVPSSSSEEDSASPASNFLAKISLSLPKETPLRIALDQRARVDHPGEVVHGLVEETVYAFDQPVIPAGSVVSGRIVSIDPVSGVKRTLAYANGNFSPFHKYKVTFETLTLPDGRQFQGHDGFTGDC